MRINAQYLLIDRDSLHSLVSYICGDNLKIVQMEKEIQSGIDNGFINEINLEFDIQQVKLGKEAKDE